MSWGTWAGEPEVGVIVEVVDSVALACSLAGQQLSLVISVQVYTIVHAPHPVADEQFPLDAGLSGCGHQCG